MLLKPSGGRQWGSSDHYRPETIEGSCRMFRTPWHRDSHYLRTGSNDVRGLEAQEAPDLLGYSTLGHERRSYRSLQELDRERLRSRESRLRESSYKRLLFGMVLVHLSIDCLGKQLEHRRRLVWRDRFSRRCWSFRPVAGNLDRRLVFTDLLLQAHSWSLAGTVPSNSRHGSAAANRIRLEGYRNQDLSTRWTPLLPWRTFRSVQFIMCTLLITDLDSKHPGPRHGIRDSITSFGV